MNLFVKLGEAGEVVGRHQFGTTKIIDTLLNLIVHEVWTVVLQRENERIL